MSAVLASMILLVLSDPCLVRSYHRDVHLDHAREMNVIVGEQAAQDKALIFVILHDFREQWRFRIEGAKADLALYTQKFPQPITGALCHLKVKTLGVEF